MKETSRKQARQNNCRKITALEQTKSLEETARENKRAKKGSEVQGD